MKKNKCEKSLYIMFISLIMFTFLGCKGGDDSEKLPYRTVIAYMGGDNNLSKDLRTNIDSMEVAYNGDGNFIIYYDANNSTPKLIQLVKENGVTKENIIKEYEESKASSPEVMKDVIDEVIKRFPAQTYGLIVSSHGDGWLPKKISFETRAIIADGSTTTDYMEIDELQGVLVDYKFEYILFDACLMSNVESCYAFRNDTKYIIASVAEIPGTGFPYANIMNELLTGSTEIDYKDICRKYYESNMMDTSIGWASITLIKTDEFETLASISKEILQKYKDDIEEFLLDENNIRGIQYYDRNNLIDYIDYALSDLKDFYQNFYNEAERTNFLDALNSVVIYTQSSDYLVWNYIQVKEGAYSGISTYLPRYSQAALNDYYNTHFEWATDSGMTDIISSFAK